MHIISPQANIFKRTSSSNFLNKNPMDSYAGYNNYLPPYNLEPSNINGYPSSFCPDFDFSSKQHHPKTSHMIRWNSGKRVDPRLLGMLEMFGEIYVERREFFDKIFHGDHEEVFKKIGHALKTKKKQMSKSGSMKRSTSMRAIRQRGLDAEEINELRAERFKIRTPNVIVAEGDEQGAQAANDSK
ncbi:uncharacterized protein LOC131006192 [Salvia miltiorrhiza]|uniref:uncharacterized protein LOC131006192 n=1 Tax=Salvia miltiorrhiza TaxID=226208 RepID=UPI0025AC8606|nr:uncharacterized protein LOC131006192 [Salvia miltiorrhiza]